MNKSLPFVLFTLSFSFPFLSLKAEELSPIDLSQYDQSSAPANNSYRPSSTSSYGQSNQSNAQRSYISSTQSWQNQQAAPTIRINPDSDEDQNVSQKVDQTEEQITPSLPKSTRVNTYPSADQEARPAAQTHYRSRPEVEEQHLISRTSYDQPHHTIEPLPEEATPETKSKKLAFMLRELSEVREAAVSAGGDIKVSISTVGIDAEDLIVPLKKQGIFDVELREDSDRVIVKSKEMKLMPLEKDIADLKMERRRLLNDIADLQNMKNNNKSAPSHEPSASDYRNMSYNKVAISDEVATVTLAPQLK